MRVASEGQERGAPLRAHAVVALIYLVVAILFTYPIVAQLTSAIGGQQDALENYWSIWWARKALLDLGENPLRGSYLHHPFGLALYFHTLNLLGSVLMLPVQLCCGVAAAYNTLVLFALTLAATGSYALAWYLTRHRPAAFLAGLIYAFSPYVAFHLHVGQIPSLMLGWLPLYLLAVLKGLRERWTFLPLASLVLLLTALSDWHYLAYAVTLTGLVGLYEAAQTRQLRAALLVFGKLALVGGLFALLFAPILLPMLAELAREPYARRPIEHSVVHSADLLAFFLPSIFHPLWGAWASQIFYDRLVAESIIGGIATLGYATLALALLGAVADVRRSRLFAILAVIFFVLALGPYLQVNGVNTFYTDRPIPLPYLLFRRLPFMDIQRLPSRFVVVVMLALAMLAAIGARWLWHHPRVAALSPRGRGALVALLALLILFEFWPRPFRMSPTGPEQVSSFYRQLGADAADYAILEVPYIERRGSMFYQAYHRKRTVGGRIARQKLHPWYDARFFGPLLQVREPWPEIGADDGAPAWRAALACQNVRYVVFYKHDLDRRQQASSRALQQALFGDSAPAYEDQTLRAYGPLSDVPREPYWTPAPGEWHPPEVGPSGTTFRWLKDGRGALLIYPCGQQQALLRFNAASFGGPRTLEVVVNGQAAGSFAFGADELKTIEVPLALHPGENRVELRSPEPPLAPSAEDPRLLSFHVSWVAVIPR